MSYNSQGSQGSHGQPQPRFDPPGGLQPPVVMPDPVRQSMSEAGMAATPPATYLEPVEAFEDNCVCDQQCDQAMFTILDLHPDERVNGEWTGREFCIPFCCCPIRKHKITTTNQRLWIQNIEGYTCCPGFCFQQTQASARIKDLTYIALTRMGCSGRTICLFLGIFVLIFFFFAAVIGLTSPASYPVGIVLGGLVVGAAATIWAMFRPKIAEFGVLGSHGTATNAQFAAMVRKMHFEDIRKTIYGLQQLEDVKGGINGGGVMGRA